MKKWYSKSLFITLNFIFLFEVNAQKKEELGRIQPYMIGLKGTIYRYKVPLRYKMQTIGYSDTIENTKPIGVVYTQSLNISERELDVPFPGVPKNNETFCIIYKGKFEVIEPSIYTFYLHSDDGSRLWIDTTEVINHDGIHQFNPPKKGQIHLNQGIHNIKVWYFQGFPTRMGLVLKMKSDKDSIFKPFDLKPYEDEFKKYAEIDNGILKVRFNDKILFDSGKFDIKDTNSTQLTTIKRLILFYPYAKVRIEGHTDNVGSANSNMTLSDNRAKAVATYLLSQNIPATIKIETKGFGMTQPISNNNTTEGKALNRRVDIFIETN